MKPKTIETFLPTGDPLEIQILNETTSVIKIIHINQNQIEQHKNRIDCNGCYILYGKDEDEQEKIYIGEADNVFKRLKQHKKNKDFWNYAFIIAHIGNKFDKVNLHFLENLMIKETLSAGRFIVENGNLGQENNITENKQAESINFFEDIKLILHTLGLNLFKPKNNKINVTDDNTFYFKGSELGFEAKAIYENDELTVLKGSTAVLNLQKSNTKHKLQNKLILENVLKEENGYFVFQEDYTFDSPSASGCIVSGRNANGWITWKNTNNVTLDKLHRNKD